MIKVKEVLVSEDIRNVHFTCHLEQCKGGCCVEGELGAPLENTELPVLRDILDKISSYLSPQGLKSIKKHGAYVLDEDGDFSTPTVNGRECAYARYDNNGVLRCTIEQAYLDNKITFRKPISCHLYPIRVIRKNNFEALNYHYWNICSSACVKGKREKIPLYVFLKGPLIRKYGVSWYRELVRLISKAE